MTPEITYLPGSPTERLRRFGPLLLCALLPQLPSFAQTNNAAAYAFTTIAGEASAGSSDGIGDAAQFNRPAGVATDGSGNVYVTDFFNHTIRKVTPAGVVTTIAGFAGSSGTADGSGGVARFNSPNGVAADNQGNLYVADRANDTIRRLTPAGTNWLVSTIVGLAGSPGTADGTNSAARFFSPSGITADTNGNIYVADGDNDTVRKITLFGTNWVVATIAGLARSYGSANGTNSEARFHAPQGITIDKSGNLYVADSDNYAIRKITSLAGDWVVSTIAGLAGSLGSTDGTNADARFGANSIAAPYGGPNSVATDGLGNLYVTDSGNHTIRELTPSGSDWVVTTLAGLPGSSGMANGVGNNARFNFPEGVAVDGSGNIYVADSYNNTIRKVTSAGVVRTAAGLTASFGGVDGVGRNARFNLPGGVAVDSAGNTYVADTQNHTVRQISSAGQVNTLAGVAGVSGSLDGVASNARFKFPGGVAVDSPGNIYVADTQNYLIRKITPAGVVSAIAGLAGTSGTADGTNSDARFSTPVGIALHGATDLYVADGDRIRKITNLDTNWVTTTIAHITGQAQGLSVDSSANVYYTTIDLFSGTDLLLKKLTLVDTTNWIPSTIGQWSSPAPSSYLSAVALDGSGNIYVADAINNVLRKLTFAGIDWDASIIGGAAGSSVGSADGAGDAARFNVPQGIAVDSAGNVYVADSFNNTIRKGVFTAFTSANAVPYSSPSTNSQLQVNLSPPEANGQWRFPWEFGWRDSGTAATNLASGNYDVQFRNLPGWLAIPPRLLGIAVAVDSTNVITTNVYYPTINTVDTNNGGSLTVYLGPNPPSGSGWRFLGDNLPFFPSGYTTNLLPGTYLIEFAGPFGGRATPPNLSVQVFAGVPAVISVNYPLTASAPSGVLLPFGVSTDRIRDLTNYPFGFNGQLQTDVGYGSGVVVQPNVVLTAAHLVFDDQMMSYASQAYWFFRREAGVNEPAPLLARGWYVLSSYASGRTNNYAAQRTNDLTGVGGQVYLPDQSSPESRNLDVAALYFHDPAAGGGYGGYLPSDAVPNSWLSSTSLKMLAGYPVDGSLFGLTNIVPGRMYQTDPQPYPLNLAPDQVNEQQEVYLAPWFLGYPGDSGGPLYVEFNGYYYPAGVYLGTLYNGSSYSSAVRAIDSSVVNLIAVAQADAGTGTNNTGGGVITIIPGQVSTSNPGYIQFRLGPPAAVLAGAAWRLGTNQPYSLANSTTNLYTVAVTSTNALSVDFKQIPGWERCPSNGSINLHRVA